MPDWEYILYVAYLVIGPVAWLFYGFLMYAGRRKMQLLERPPHTLPAGVSPPATSIIIPAKDEGERIRACIQSCLDQDYADFEVIAVDDRSVDTTGAIMDEMAAKNPHLNVIHIQEGTLGPGWTGKNNALYTAQKQARGQWLLFVDSDVILQRDALAATMTAVVNRRYDLISLLPRLECHTIWERMLVPLAGAAASTMYAISLNNNNDRKNSAFANGQYLMISRPVYDAIGGHATVKDRYCEDVAIALLLKQAGYRPRVAWGNDWCAVRMYSSLPAIIRGWSRIYYAAKVGSPWRTLIASLFLIFCCFTPVVVLPFAVYRHYYPINAFGGWGWAGTAVAHIVLMLYFLSIVYHWSGNKRTTAFYFPIAGPMLLGIMCRALWMCVTKKVTWRGTSYQHVMATKLPEAKPAEQVGSGVGQ